MSISLAAVVVAVLAAAEQQPQIGMAAAVEVVGV
jgi:hypothetical protein